jgi:hypothetical protein
VALCHVALCQWLTTPRTAYFSATLSGLLDPEAEGTTVCRNVGSYSPNDTASHHRTVFSTAVMSSSKSNVIQLLCVLLELESNNTVVYKSGPICDVIFYCSRFLYFLLCVTFAFLHQLLNLSTLLPPEFRKIRKKLDFLT